VQDCIAYLSGLVSSAEVLPVVRQQRDKMLTRVAIGALQRSLEALGMRDLGRAMQAVTDAWALGVAMPALDEFTVLRIRCARALFSSLLEERLCVARFLQGYHTC
jgi:hypothetical protein